jgi:hypothetical protein
VSGGLSGQFTDFAALYGRAFAEFGTRWLDAPQPEDALVIVRALRVEGNVEARRLAEPIEQACRAAIQAAVIVSSVSCPKRPSDYPAT